MLVNVHKEKIGCMLYHPQHCFGDIDPYLIISMLPDMPKGRTEDLLFVACRVAY